ncbi:hypothetical protein BB560_001470 [Smittium megazygosporum]|uniref:Alanine--tRNA ligase n=1 Tax=Smittium megazygosporum TaxID=133381 RepID=A0A2T9ZHF8_9FUNG|nr:hypothetical protein BB560_001470 [Smittium megazygosporum]
MFFAPSRLPIHINRSLILSSPTVYRFSKLTDRYLYLNSGELKMTADYSNWSGDKVRSTFIDFFVDKQHVYYKSSPVVPHDDPTLLFANAGMNQFKPIFLGISDPNSDMAKLARACNSQKCIRAGGKHNDLEDVGKDVYHHTFFEMLGNWSFGNYFKKEAIEYAWELLTVVYGLDQNRLYVTYFGGDASQNLEPDLEAKEIWLNLGLPEARILPFGSKDNFWEMGEVGPCGPCSEIHYDRIGNRDAASLVNMDDPDVLEIWNLVFMQYNREDRTTLRTLPNKHIDTGMGFERLVSVLQNKKSNYDTDVFMPIFQAIEQSSKTRPYSGKIGDDDVDGIDMAYRVIADHIRTLVFAISDGAIPSNEGRGYVVRRILRRGARYARKKMNVELGAFFADLVDVVVAQLGNTFNEISRQTEFIKQILMEEERSFSRTLDRGEKLFENTLSKMRENNQLIVPGAEVWKLYDTFGFPVDLTRIMAEENNLEKNNTVKTNDIFKYTDPEITSNIVAIFSDKQFVQKEERSLESSGGSVIPVGILLDQTNFYAESGGQEADTGSLFGLDNSTEFTVTQVKSFGGYVLHAGFLTSGSLSVGEQVRCIYNYDRRSQLKSNHTATHILNYSLRKVLDSPEVDQRGSLVSEDKLRFDFSFNSQLSPELVRDVQADSNKVVDDGLQVYSKEVDLQTAKSINGIRAIFGETYPNPVRVVSVGANLEEVVSDMSNENWSNYSVELCGGTHVSNTKEIGSFIITEESSISKGIRRIVAVTGKEAIKVQEAADAFSKELDALNQIKGSELESALKLIGKRLDTLNTGVWQKHLLRQKYADIRKKFLDADKEAKLAASKFVSNLVATKVEANPEIDFHVLKVEFEGGNAGSNNKALANAISYAKSLNTKAVYLISPDSQSGKVSHMCFVPKILITKGLKAKEWASAVSKVVGGKSGGRDDTAQGSGTNISSSSEAEQIASEFAALSLKD